ncbi:hypothetical protein BIV08_18445 [Pseudomonas sp. AF76]|nr:hypothetical protein BIV08_18445 [Pseudomonas sp. AF76]
MFFLGALLKKQPIGYKPCRTSDAADCPHLIHRHVHSNRGQVQTLQAAVHKALRDIWKIFSLDPATQVVHIRLSAISRHKDRRWLEASNDGPQRSLSSV